MSLDVALLLRFRRDGKITAIPVVNSDVEALELAGRFRELLRFAIESPSFVDRCCGVPASGPAR